ncbi:MAG: glycosyl transferase, partial [Flavobacteriaceae bacterium]|nr:glycosyl transferase [Flavobacteriaceae bacterium]
IHCDNYGQAGAINFYGTQEYTEALSFNADYINWYDLDNTEYKHIILVKYRLDDDPNREQERPLFEEIMVVGEINDPYAREKGTRVYLLKGAKKSINQFFKKEIEDRRNNNY